MKRHYLLTLSALILATGALHADPILNASQDEVLSTSIEKALEDDLAFFEEGEDFFLEDKKEISNAIEDKIVAFNEDLNEDNPFAEDAEMLSPNAKIIKGISLGDNKLDIEIAQERAEPISKNKNMQEIASSNLLQDRRAHLKETKNESTYSINLSQVFAGSPVIYSILITLSIAASFICLYTVLSLRKTGMVPESLIREVRKRLLSNQYDEALAMCSENDNFFSKMLVSGIATRKHGLPVMVETMKAEGKRATTGFWQRLALINDIAIVAPMLGLLGTVLGMFYAFYDLNRSRESVNTLFDGLGVSVGTTVAGLVVAIVAMILHSIAKYRLVKAMTFVENEVQTFAALIDGNTSIYQNRGK